MSPAAAMPCDKLNKVQEIRSQLRVGVLSFLIVLLSVVPIAREKKRNLGSPAGVMPCSELRGGLVELPEAECNRNRKWEFLLTLFCPYGRGC